MVMSEFEMMYLNYVLKDTQSQQNILFSFIFYKTVGYFLA